jgi:hypothetical protein
VPVVVKRREASMGRGGRPNSKPIPKPIPFILIPVLMGRLMPPAAMEPASIHKEFKRRTKPMEIVAGEESVYRILAFVAMKMEVSWRNAPFRNSGFRKLKPFAGYFTHES